MKNSYVIGDSLVDKNLARNAKLKYLEVTKNSNLLKIVKIWYFICLLDKFIFFFKSILSVFTNFNELEKGKIRG